MSMTKSECDVCFAPATVVYPTDLGDACEQCHDARARWLSMTPQERADEQHAIAEHVAATESENI